MSAMRLTSALGGLMALLGAVVAFFFLPNRKDFAQLNGPRQPAAAQEHVDAVPS